MEIETDWPGRTVAGTASVRSRVTAYSTTFDTTVDVGETTWTCAGYALLVAFRVTVAVWPMITEETSVSETLAVTWSWLRSAIVMNPLELAEDEELLELPEPEEDEPAPDPVLVLLDEDELEGAPVVVVPALTEEPTSPAMVSTVPAVGAVITVPATAVCAVLTAAWAVVTDSWSCAIVPGST